MYLCYILMLEMSLKIKRHIIGLIGTFTVIFCGLRAMTTDQAIGGSVTRVGVGITWGLIAMTMIYAFCEVSGAYLKLAVSIAFASAKRFSWKEVPKHTLFLLTGAFLASLLLLWLFPESRLMGATIPSIGIARAFFLKLILTFF